jgi:hypothetical protein
VHENARHRGQLPGVGIALAFDALLVCLHRYWIQKIRQKKCVSRQLLRVRIIRKEVHQLVAEDRVAARLEDDDWCASLDFRPQRAECGLQQMSRARPSSFNGKTARKSLVSRATCNSPFIAGPSRRRPRRTDH